MHLLTIVNVNIEICCKCLWTVYCWLVSPLHYRFRAEGHCLLKLKTV